MLKFGDLIGDLVQLLVPGHIGAQVQQSSERVCGRLLENTATCDVEPSLQVRDGVEGFGNNVLDLPKGGQIFGDRCQLVAEDRPWSASLVHAPAGRWPFLLVE